MKKGMEIGFGVGSNKFEIFEDIIDTDNVNGNDTSYIEEDTKKIDHTNLFKIPKYLETVNIFILFIILLSVCFLGFLF
jgi:hypothetical protein